MERLKLRFDTSVFFALALYVLLGEFWQFFGYVLCVVLHEFAHFVVANRLFYKCTQMQISCFGAVLFGDFNSACKRDTVLIALAGPLANFLVAFLCVSLWWIFPQSYYFTYDFVWANIGMATVNLLPISMLDGGKIFAVVLQKFFSKSTSEKLVKTISTILAFLLFFVFVIALFFRVFLPSLCLFSLFVLCASLSKGETLYLRRSYLENYSKRMVKGVEKKTLVFDVDVTVSAVAKRMVGGSLYDVELWKEGKLVKSYTFYQLDKVIKSASPTDKLIVAAANV